MRSDTIDTEFVQISSFIAFRKSIRSFLRSQILKEILTVSELPIFSSAIKSRDIRPSNRKNITVLLSSFPCFTQRYLIVKIFIKHLLK